MMNLVQDIRYGIRTLRAAPAFTVVAILSLGLGIGVNATIFSIVNELVLNDVTASHRGRLLNVGDGISFPNYEELERAGVFQQLSAYIRMFPLNWQSGEGSEKVFAQATTGNFFEMLGVSAARGRVYTSGETNPDTDAPVAVVSDGFWRRRLGSDPSVPGRRILLGDHPYTIIGVLPPSYRSVIGLAVTPEVYLPVGPTVANGLHSRAARIYSLTGRMPDGMTREQVRAALTTQVKRLQAAYPENAKDLDDAGKLVALGGIERMTLDSTGHALLVFFGMLWLVVGLVLLIACANVSGLLLARGASRQREVAIRLALGAGRGRLIGQFLTEGFLLSVLGTGFGMMINFWATRLLSQIRVPFPVPFEFTFAPDRQLLAYSVFLALAAAPLCALLPAIRASRPNLVGALKGDEYERRSRFTLRNFFVGGQVAVSLLLLTTAALFLRATWMLTAIDPGFDMGHTVSIDVTPVRGRYAGAQKDEFRDRILQALENSPGVAAASTASALPLNPDARWTPRVRLPGTLISDTKPENAQGVGPKYFATMRIAVVAGREFEKADLTRKPEPVIVNETFASRYFGRNNPVGQRLLQTGPRGEDVPLQIVGVSRDSKIRTLSEIPQPLVYHIDDSLHFVARTASSPEAVMNSLRHAAGSLDPSAAIEMETVRDLTAIAVWPTRIGAGLLSVLGALGLFLSLLGIYGVTAYGVARRTSEIGIRMALGSSRSGVLWLILRDGFRLVSAGVVVGLAVAAILTRPLAAVLPSTLSTTDPATIAIVIALLALTSALATFIPARRASRIDPMTALRHE